MLYSSKTSDGIQHGGPENYSPWQIYVYQEFWELQLTSVQGKEVGTIP
jgi:hypothetical protein